MIRVSFQRSVLFSPFEVPSLTNAKKKTPVWLWLVPFIARTVWKSKLRISKRNKAVNFVRQIEKFHHSVNKITERTAMTVADAHSCFLHGRCRVPFPVGILFWFFWGVLRRYFNKCSNSIPNYAAYITLHIPSFSLFINHALFNDPIFFSWHESPQWAMASPLSRIRDHIQTHNIR